MLIHHFQYIYLSRYIICPNCCFWIRTIEYSCFLVQNVDFVSEILRNLSKVALIIITYRNVGGKDSRNEDLHTGSLYQNVGLLILEAVHIYIIIYVAYMNSSTVTMVLFS